MFLTKENKLNWSRIAVAAIVTLVLVLCGVFWFDVPVFNFLRRFNCDFFYYFGAIFNAKVWLVVSFIVVSVFYVRKVLVTRPRSNLFDFFGKVKNSYAFWIFCSVCLASIVGVMLKFVIGRARPIFYEALNMTGFFPFTNDWAFNSMPSGHTFASFAGLVMLGLIAPRAKWFTWTLACLIGVSRVCVGAHWPSDVILGAFLGMISADIIMSLRGKSR